MAANDCIEEIKNAAKVDLSDDELTGLLEYLDTIKRERQAEAGLKSLEDELLDAADNLGKDKIEKAYVARRNRLINVKVLGDLIRMTEATDAKFNDPSLGLRANIGGISRVIEGGRDSVDARAKALTTKYHGGVVADLRREGLLRVFNNKDFQLDLARDLEALTKPGAKGSGNADIKKVAEIIDKHRKVAVSRFNRAGGWIKPLPGYITRQTHDAAKVMRAGYDNWRNSIINRLSPRTFEGVDNKEEFLQSVFDGIKSGVHYKYTDGSANDVDFVFKGPGNLAKKLSQERVLHFNNADDFMAYNSEFGTRSLAENIFLDLERMAKSTALMEKFGTNPRAMLDTVIDRLQKKYRSDPEKLEKLRRKGIIDQFELVDGTANIPGNNTLATVSSSVRAIQSMSKLGGAVLSSLVDPVLQSAEVHRSIGAPLLSSWGKTLGNVLDGLTPGEERKAAAELLGVGMDGMLGDVYTRFAAHDNLPGVMTKGMRLFFKANMLGPWTDANKRGFALMFSREMAMNKNKALSELNEDMQRMFSRYGIDDAKWDIARRSVRKAEDGREYLFPDGIQELPDELFSGTRRQIQRQKDDIETAIRTLITDRTDFAVLTPGAREQAASTFGLQPGTVAGEAVRFMMQFKQFPITMTTKGMGEIAFSGGAQNWKQVLMEGKFDMMGLANLIVATTIMGYVSQSAKEVAKGRKPRDPADISTWHAALLQGGGLGIYGDFLLGETNRFGRSLTETLAGPTIGAVSEAQQIFAKGLAGEPTAASLLRFGVSNTPFANLFYTRAALDYLVLYRAQEALNPGYLRRMERRVQRENNQEFIIPPTSAAR